MAAMNKRRKKSIKRTSPGLRAARAQKACRFCAGPRQRLRHGGKSLPARLTPREREVIHWGARGRTKPETASLLGLSYHTVHEHMRRVLKKLGARTVGHAIYLAHKFHLID